jgi:hypothetical protein
VSRASKEVAVIGAGPAGLAVARWLLNAGFEPEIFEATDGLGGQWRGASAMSGVWPQMTANTSRIVTRFSDLDYPAGTPMFPHNAEVLAYLEAYADRFGLTGRVRASSPVQRLEASPGGGWTLTWREADGAAQSRTFSRVVVASGRFNRPARPPIPGLDDFSGKGGVTHTFRFKDPGRFKGLKVVVAGGAISALEVASDIALGGAAEVATASRRQRYVIPKLIDGRPADSRFSRYGVHAADALPPDESAARLKAWLKAVGDPEIHGAPAPAADVRQAGVAISQHFLPLVGEGRIRPRPWIAEVAGEVVRFADGSQTRADAIVLGTGFDLHLPFLSDEIAAALDLDREHLDLADFTFHPDLPGLAFAGLIAQTGPYFPVLELQARWIAYAWSGVCPAPSAEDLQTGVEGYRATRGKVPLRPMNAVALMFARRAGVEPDLARHPALGRALLFGPLSATAFRLGGPDALADTADRIAEEGVQHGTAPTAAFTAEERELVRRVAELATDPTVRRWTELL